MNQRKISLSMKALIPDENAVKAEEETEEANAADAETETAAE